MALRHLAPLEPDTLAQLEHDFRYGDTPLLRQHSHIVLLAHTFTTQADVARAARVHRRTVSRVLKRCAAGGRAALRPRYDARPVRTSVTQAWHQGLASAMEQGPEACGIPRPTWTPELLAQHLAERTGVRVSERTVRRYLAPEYRTGRPTYTVRHKAEEQPDYVPKRLGSRRS